MSRALGKAVTTIVIAAALLLGAWFALSAATGATLISFRTGSMSPSMPQGALAVSMPIAAADIEVGDVVTVQRSDRSLPITHRVVEVRSPQPAVSGAVPSPEQRELVLKGDDNAEADFEPYLVDRARRVVVAVPGLGSALMLAQSPPGMGVLTVLAGALTVWAFWPARARGATGSPLRHRGRGRHAPPAWEQAAS